VRQERWLDEVGLTAQETDDMIVTMRRAGYPLSAIAECVRMSPSGVHRALARIADGRPGRAPRV
jgi:hypothetical protein